MNIKIEALSKSYDGKKTVLDSISLEDEVTTLAIIGPSGCGKSTLLRMIGGLLEPSDGSIWVDDEKVPFGDEKALTKYRSKLGFVFQSSGLFAHMSAHENIALPLRVVHGIEEQEAAERANEMLERFGLGSEGEKRPAQLSGGQRQRVAIARAIAPKPKILLLDEPTSALDPEYTNEVLDIVSDLKDEGTRFIIVTHEMGFARHTCNKIAFLSDHNLTEYGTSDQIFENPQTPQLQKFLAKLLEWRM